MDHPKEKLGADHASQPLEFLTTPDGFPNNTLHNELLTKPKKLEKTPHAKTLHSAPWRVGLITLSLAFGTFLIALDTTIIGIAIPTITSQFHSLDDIAWYGSAYLITLTALQPTFGRIYSLYNTKTTYLVCVGIFEVGSIICAAAPKSIVFIIGRAIAGCGAAGLFQGAFNIITTILPLEKRPLYMGIVISVFGLSACIGPVMGGAFTQNASWRWCFWINVPIGMFTFFLVLFFLKLGEDKHREGQSSNMVQKLGRLDLTGACTMIAAVICLFLSLQWGGHSKPWRSITIIGLFVGFGLLLIVFCIVQYTAGEQATLPLRILKQRSILFSVLFLFSTAISTYIYGYYLPIYFQSIKASSPTKSGLQFMTIALPQVFAIIVTGAIATKWGYYLPYILLGNLINLIGSGLLITLRTDTPTLELVIYMVITGIGTGCGVNLPYTAVQVVLDVQDVPTGNAVLQFAYQLGASIGLSIGQTIFINELTFQVEKKTPLISPTAVVTAGASNLRLLASTPQLLGILRVLR